MKKIVFIFFCLCFINLIYSQTDDSVKIKRVTFDSYEELREKQNLAEIDFLTYLDSILNFQVKVPNWLNLKETGTAYLWGGTLPAVDNIENAICIKSFDKNKHKSLEDFRKYIVEDLIFGQKTPWGENHTFMGKKDLGKHKNIGNAYIVYLMYDTKLYYCKYVLTESKTAYLWIDFTSTQETFDKNVSMFDEFLDGFEITDF